jgi:hypothetical protein
MDIIAVYIMLISTSESSQVKMSLILSSFADGPWSPVSLCVEEELYPEL